MASITRLELVLRRIRDSLGDHLRNYAAVVVLDTVDELSLAVRRDAAQLIHEGASYETVAGFIRLHWSPGAWTEEMAADVVPECGLS